MSPPGGTPWSPPFTRCPNPSRHEPGARERPALTLSRLARWPLSATSGGSAQFGTSSIARHTVLRCSASTGDILEGAAALALAAGGKGKETYKVCECKGKGMH